ncbi:MAG: amino-acid N-acetyltransferase [Actinobacteria bacterium]|nr:amino-acid N-acetyltransferase [Actinomycetota bacterium]MBU1608980.1 amino-acid N-acetyltransferase [Actinomycetota bacterium]MBU2316877.1 amino-acid N-acetyltransferase [Actinomycetota bacterium]MBU2386129.1 amino-acid N-acetyltransferase [Actinomycetota bacterium]
MTGQSSLGRRGFSVRQARTADVRGIHALVEPLVQERILLGKELVVFFESVQEFSVAVDDDSGDVIGCGALHVLWEDLGEVRTLAVQERWRGTGVGHAIYERLEQQARELGLRRLFCLTFETDFFGRHGFVSIGEELLVDPEVYSELVRSPDEGVAEFLDLSRVKPNTLGNSRLLKEL